MGFIIFAVFLLFSFGGKLMRSREKREEREERPEQPKWPGPVAGPGVPGYPRPAWPESPQRPQTPPAAAKRGQIRGPELGEGMPGGEGVGSGMEGPGSASTADQVSRFIKESDLFASSLRSSGDWFGNLSQAEPGTEPSVAKPAGPRLEVQQALHNRVSAAQAVVLATVLGPPKGRRRR